MNILVIHPVPRAFERHRRLHSQAFLRRCTIEDRLVEMRDNNDPYPESATICEEVTPAVTKDGLVRFRGLTVEKVLD